MNEWRRTIRNDLLTKVVTHCMYLCHWCGRTYTQDIAIEILNYNSLALSDKQTSTDGRYGSIDCDKKQ